MADVALLVLGNDSQLMVPLTTGYMLHVVFPAWSSSTDSLWAVFQVSAEEADEETASRTVCQSAPRRAPLSDSLL